jgi:hypothetical protein
VNISITIQTPIDMNNLESMAETDGVDEDVYDGEENFGSDDATEFGESDPDWYESPEDSDD